MKFEYVEEDKVYDTILLLNGCRVACVSKDRLKTKNGFINIDSDNINMIYKKFSDKGYQP